MTKTVTLLPSAGLKGPREVLRFPHLHTEEEIAAACEVLRRHGDWLDHERASFVLRTLGEFRLRAAVERSRRRRAQDVALLILAASIVVSVAVFFIASDAVWRLAQFIGVI